MKSLNGAGPPQKDANGWKKFITEWKSEIKNKLAHNKLGRQTPGGRPFSKYQLFSTEETIGLCGLPQTVEDIPGEILVHMQPAVQSTSQTQNCQNTDMPLKSQNVKAE